MRAELMFDDLGRAMFGGFVVCMVLAGAVGIGLWELLKWVFAHLHVVWR